MGIPNPSFVRYVIGCLLRGQPGDCPDCGSSRTSLIGRKKVLIQLRRCDSCGLQFRYPKMDETASREFYDHIYSNGITTNVPGDLELSGMLKSNFCGTAKDFSDKVALLRSVCPGGRVLDYGCSWGYGVHQLKAAGFDAVGYEIAGDRAAFGREKLGVDVIDEEARLAALPSGSFDAVFSNHVLEHMNRPSVAFACFARLLRPGGHLLIFVPNCGGTAARTAGPKWMVDAVHVLALEANYFGRALPAYGFEARAFSSPYDGEALSRGSGAGELTGNELCIYATRAAP